MALLTPTEWCVTVFFVSRKEHSNRIAFHRFNLCNYTDLSYSLNSIVFYLMKAVVLSVAGFESMTPPFIVQEYRDHNECFYKVYVINEEVMVFRRPSLPNLDDLAVLAGNERNPHHTGESDRACGFESHYFGLKSVAFDSRYAYPTAADFRDESYDSTEQHEHDSNGQMHFVSHSQSHSHSHDHSHSNGHSHSHIHSHSHSGSGSDYSYSNGSRNCDVNDRHDRSTNDSEVKRYSPATVTAAAFDANLKLSVQKFGASSSAVDAHVQIDSNSAVKKLLGYQMGDNGDHRRSSTDSTGGGVSTTQVHSSPFREPLNRVSVLSLEGRAKKPSAKDMPPLSSDNSPSSSSGLSGCNIQLQHQMIDMVENGHSSAQYGHVTEGVCQHQHSPLIHITNGNFTTNTPSTSTSITHTEHTVENNRSDCLMAHARTARTAHDATKHSNNTHSTGGPSSRRKSISINEGVHHAMYS